MPYCAGAASSSKRIALRRDESAVAETAEVFRREEAVATNVADRPAAVALVGRAERLGDVFHNLQTMLFREAHHRVHVGGLAVEMDRHDRLGARRELGFRGVDCMPKHTGQTSQNTGVAPVRAMLFRQSRRR